MADPHQINSLIAAAISECRTKPAEIVSTEEAKIIAKCVVQQLGDAGFQIVHVSPERDHRPSSSPTKNKSAQLIGEVLDKLRAS